MLRGPRWSAPRLRRGKVYIHGVPVHLIDHPVAQDALALMPSILGDERVGPVEQEAIAAQLYLEMLKAGYTSVAEFHYLHHDPAGRPYANPAEMALRIVAAASDAGIGLTLLPVFYAHSDFGGAAPTQAQRRFIHGPDSFRALLGRLVENDQLLLGVAPHSLRAVTREELEKVVRMAPGGIRSGAAGACR